MYIHTWNPSKNHNRGKCSWWCGLYRHNDDDTAHLPCSQALAAFVTCKFVKTCKYLGIKLLSTSAPSTITTVSQSYTPFYSFQSLGVGHILNLFGHYLQDYGTSCDAILLHWGESREGKTEKGWGSSSYLVEVLPESLEEFLSILLNHPPQCSQLLCTILLGQGAATAEPIPHTWHNLDEEKHNKLDHRTQFVPLPNTTVHYNIDLREVSRMHSGMFKQDPRLLVCPTNNYYSIVIQDH